VTYPYADADEYARAKNLAEFTAFQDQVTAEGKARQRAEEYAEAVAAHNAANDEAKKLTNAAVKKHGKAIAAAIAKFHDDVNAAVDVERRARQARIDAGTALPLEDRPRRADMTVPGGFPTPAGHVVAAVVETALRERGIAEGQGQRHWTWTEQ
jgi:hypothetical protein